jgi:hypothetical protein
MGFQTKEKLRAELRSFFGLTILNLVIAALVLGLGISTTITHLLDVIETENLLPLSVLLMGLGVAALAAGFYWIIQVAQIVDGVDDLKAANDRLGKGDGEQATSLFIDMLAYYRSNKTTVSRMAVLGKIGGALFLIVGAIGLVQAGVSIISSGVLADNLSQLVGGIMALGVGIAGLLISRYFSIYSKVWDARLQETTKIEDALQHELEAN